MVENNWLEHIQEHHLRDMTRLYGFAHKLDREVPLQFAILNEMERRQDEMDRLQKENDDLRLQLQAAREQLAYAPQWVVGVDPACPNCDKTILLDHEALEPDAPDGQMKHFFNIYSGPYQTFDTQQERDFTWAYGPYSSFAEADREWKAYIKRQREIGK